MRLIKIHKISRFKQSEWLKNTLILILLKKKKSVNSFDKDFLKLMNNSIFGKTMENLRKSISVKLVNNSKDYVRCVSKPNFISQKGFSKNFVAIHQVKPVLLLNKPIYVRFSILGLNINSTLTILQINLMLNCCLLIQTV